MECMHKAHGWSLGVGTLPALKARKLCAPESQCACLAHLRLGRYLCPAPILCIARHRQQEQQAGHLEKQQAGNIVRTQRCLYGCLHCVAAHQAFQIWCRSSPLCRRGAQFTVLDCAARDGPKQERHPTFPGPSWSTMILFCSSWARIQPKPIDGEMVRNRRAKALRTPGTCSLLVSSST